MNALTPVPSPLLKAFSAVARWSLRVMLSAWLLFAVLWGTLHWFIVPRIGDFRPQLEAQASKALGMPVTMGAITAQSNGMIPSFELSDVKLFDAQGRPALTLARVVVALSPKSALSGGFEQIYVDRPQLDIRRTVDGRVILAGIDLSKNDGRQDGSAADWIFSQAELVLRHGTLTWTDEMRARPALKLGEVDLVLRNRFRNHSLRVDATPSPQLGDRFTTMAVFKQPLLSRQSGEWRQWAGQIYGSFERVDVAQLARYVDVGSVAVVEGTGALRAWVDVDRGELTNATADLALAQVNTTLGPQLAPLALQSVAGRLAGRQLKGGFEFLTQNLQFQTQEGLRWPGGNFRLTYVDGAPATPGRTDGQGLSQGNLVADRLDLKALSQIADRLPLGDQARGMLAAWAPQGLVENITASWHGPLNAIGEFEAKGRVVGLALTYQRVGPEPGSAGFRGATVDFEATQVGGRANVVFDNGSIDVPGIFEDPQIQLAQLSAEARWQVEGERIAVQVPNLKFSNADGQGEAQVKWNTGAVNAARNGGRFPGVLDLQASLSRVEGTRVHRYLPVVVHKPVRDYVREAVQKGTASGVKFKVKGDLFDMPFANAKQGDFTISANFSDVTLAYVPRVMAPVDSLPWPELVQMSGQLLIDRLTLKVLGASGRVAGPASAGGKPGLQITKGEAQIPDLLHSPTLVVSAEARGALPLALGAVNESPLKFMTRQALVGATATGQADLRLKLNLPLAAIDKVSVQGSLTLAGNDVQMSADTPLLSRARGVLNFSESGFGLANFQVRFWGGDVRLDGGTVGFSTAGNPAAARPATAPASPIKGMPVGNLPRAGASAADAAREPPAIVLRAQGTATAEALRQAKELGFVSRIAQHASGSTEYSALLGVRRGVPELVLSSSLVGLALNLPSPMAKPAQTALPLRFENAVLREPSSGTGADIRPLDQVKLDIGHIASVVYVRDVSGDAARVMRGSIAVGLAPGESAPLPEQGVQANINIPNLDLDAWSAVLAQSTGATMTAPDTPPNPAPGAAIATIATATTVGSRARGAMDYLPTILAVRSRELTVGGRTFNNVVVGGSREGSMWRANMDARELNGYGEYRQASGAGVGANAGRVYARLARLTLAQAATKDVEAVLDEQPGSIPALDVVVDDLELKGKRLGRVEIEAVNRNTGTVARDGNVREWRLSKFNVTMPEAVFTATGNWASINAQSAALPGGGSSGLLPLRRRTVMNFKLDIVDAGDLLTRFGMKDVIRRGKGKLDGQVAWVGSPLSPDFPSLGGAFTLAVESGQFLKADPGLAKLLGVLSLQSLPRRLALDFRDVFSEGFSFDFVRGDVAIDQGIASTNNLQMKGVNAAVLMDGRANIAKETQDIRVVVVPEINAGTASLIATAINPAIGLGTFLAQLLLRRPLIESATQEFHVDGTWVDPVVTRVARKSDTKTDAKPQGPQ